MELVVVRQTPVIQAGSNSIFSTITSAGGGRGGLILVVQLQCFLVVEGMEDLVVVDLVVELVQQVSGNTPPTTPAQGSNGGPGSPSYLDLEGGSGGATAVGQPAVVI